MDSQDKTSAEREGTPPASATDDSQKAPAEDSTKLSKEEAKAADRTEVKKKKVKDKGSKKHAKSRQRKSNSSSASESDDPKDGLSSDGNSDLDEDVSGQKGFKKKRETKKSQGTQSSKKKGHTRKQKKAVKLPRPAVSDSESDSSETEDDDDSADGGDAASQLDLAKQEVANLKQQLIQSQQLQQLGNPYQQAANPYQQAANPPNPYQQAANPYQLAPNPYQQYGQASLGSGLSPATAFNSGLRLGGATLSGRNRGGHHPSGRSRLSTTTGGVNPSLLLDLSQQLKDGEKTTKLDYKRVDQVWDSTIHNYKLQDTAEGANESLYDDFIFHVRRTFDWEGKYKATFVDIKSKLLRECLQDVVGNIKGISLVEDTPKIDPNMLFLYLEDLEKYLKALKKVKPRKGDKHERKKERKRIDSKRQHLKVLIRYIDKDYKDVKNSLYPMLENGLITFDLLWALWKPNTLVFTTTYGSHDEPRVFKVEMAEKRYNIMKGGFYSIEGKYFEYDGKQFGFGSMSEEIGEFQGARRITSLKCYPLNYHKNKTQLRKDLIDRGKKFVALGGVHYKSHQGMAYYKKKKAIVKVNINGRIMVDPSIHRRINPNYQIAVVRPKDHDIVSGDEDSDDESGGSGCGSDSENAGDSALVSGDVKYVTKAIQDRTGKTLQIRLPKPNSEDGTAKEKLDRVPAKDDEATPSNGGYSTPRTDGESEKKPPEFTDEEYLMASPVVLGFAFAEKMWLEFTVSGVKDIQWNESAYESLVLEAKTKDIVKALVESHKYHAAESIDDVIQGKGKGLVAVLHGPPGTGKTLTAEGISELLKSPLYMVSAGELGTNSQHLEGELQRILDICHTWGAILLLDEADVFLEKRNLSDIHRNALVSIFLRQLEYFQGILFLTTNRVETFDEAFQSRIHIALRYGTLDHRAKKAIFKIFIERVRVLGNLDIMPFTDDDLDVLARHELNGRQIKNTVRTAQALAVNKGESLSMAHIRQVLEVQISFDRDLKGGTGYEEAMMSYS